MDQETHRLFTPRLSDRYTADLKGQVFLKETQQKPGTQALVRVYGWIRAAARTAQGLSTAGLSRDIALAA